MDILLKLEGLIDSLKNRPQAVSLDNIQNTLLEAHEAVANGLNRSHTARVYSRLEDEIGEFKEKNQKLSGEVIDLKNKVTLQDSNFGHLNVLFQNLKKITKGRIELAYSQNPELIKTMQLEIDQCVKACDLLKIQAQTDSDLKNVFSNHSTHIDIKPDADNKINPHLYRIGG